MVLSQPAITCSKLTIETLKQVMKWRRSGVLSLLLVLFPN